MLGIVYLAELPCFTQTDLIIAFYCWRKLLASEKVDLRFFLNVGTPFRQWLEHKFYCTFTWGGKKETYICRNLKTDKEENTSNKRFHQGTNIVIFYIF